MSVCLLRRVRGRSGRLIEYLGLLGGWTIRVLMLLVRLLVVLHLFAHLALHVLVLRAGVAAVDLVAVAAHVLVTVLVGGLGSSVTGETRLLLGRFSGLWLVAIVEPGMLVALLGRAVAHHHCA